MKIEPVIKTALVMMLSLAFVQITAALPGKKTPAKIPYVLPDAMAEPIRAEFTKQCDKGQALYNLTCAGCHNQRQDGKTIVPDWPTEKLIGYELRVMNPQHESGLPDEHVTAEELGYIMTFLMYKKKNS